MPAASYSVISDTEILATSPAHSLGAVQVVVTTITSEADEYAKQVLEQVRRAGLLR